ncbi:MAG TPA: prolyl oligopeptidase family serine peptidase [Thermoanaerobaculia bacterium]|nr:prolyl oligopeptidase family serine peptidase [Thermoanaerobaculia bacterium]
MRSAWVFLALMAAACATTDTTVVPSFPSAPVQAVVDTYHGREVTDPYRWMESPSPEMTRWLEAQNQRARAVLTSLPGRDAILHAITRADRGITRVTLAEITGSDAAPRIFLWKRLPDAETASIWVRDGWSGNDRLVLDPRSRDAGDVHHSVDFVAPSPDGRYLAYGISSSGSEDSVIEILDVDRGTVLPEKIDRAQYAAISWRADNRSFYYWRRARPAPNASRADWFKNSATFLHTLGDDPEKATPIFGPMVQDICTECFSWVQVSPASPFVLAGATPGTSADLEYFLKSDDGWRRLSTRDDHIYGMTAHGDRIYALSYADAPRYRIVEFDAASGSLSAASDFLPQQKEIIENFVTAKDAMYVQLLDRGLSRIIRIPWDGSGREEVKLPFGGAIYGLRANADRPGAQFVLSSWTVAPSTYAFEPGRGLRDLGLVEKWPIDYSSLVSEEVEVRSADGTSVPMSIIRPRSFPMNGSRPALLQGYAAYGSTQSPYFWPIGLTWVERGGVLADCHARGGGARGKEWHLGGIKANKERGVEDFAACAEYLIDRGYTRATRLSVTGTSAGGLLAGGVITKRPELFTAALLRVPLVNLLRFENTEGGPANVPEYGSVARADDFPAMLASDPYHRIRDGVKYPAVVLTGGAHDVRVPIWQPAKFAARLQQASTGGPVLLRVETGAGHGLGSTRSQIREEWADLFAFALWRSGR